MSASEKEQIFTRLEQRGEAEVRAMLETNQWGRRKPLVLEWLLLKELAKAEQAKDRDEAALAVARASVAASTASALEAQSSSRWAKISAWAAVASAAVAVLALILGSFGT